MQGRVLNKTLGFMPVTYSKRVTSNIMVPTCSGQDLNNQTRSARKGVHSTLCHSSFSPSWGDLYLHEPCSLRSRCSHRLVSWVHIKCLEEILSVSLSLILMVPSLPLQDTMSMGNLCDSELGWAVFFSRSAGQSLHQSCIFLCRFPTSTSGSQDHDLESPSVVTSEWSFKATPLRGGACQKPLAVESTT